MENPAEDFKVLRFINGILASGIDIGRLIKEIHLELKEIIDFEGMTIGLLRGGSKKCRLFLFKKSSLRSRKISGCLLLP